MRYFLPEILLLHAAYTDMRTRDISGVILIIFGALGVICTVFGRAVGVTDACFGAAIGLIMIFISIMTRGELGMGDGMLIAVTGLFLGIRDNIALLSGALLLSAVFSVVLLITGRKLKQEYPFVPFLLLTYSAMFMGGMFG